MKFVKEKIIGATGSVSGVSSIIGSWQVCHNVCLGLVTLLGVIGITVTGMPLAFLTKVQTPLWIFAVALLGVTGFLYVKKRCVSNKLLLFNSGLIIAGIPFFKTLSIGYWLIGGGLAVVGVVLFIVEKINKRRFYHA